MLEKSLDVKFGFKVAEIAVPVSTLMLLVAVGVACGVEGMEDLVAELATIVMFCEEAR